MKIFVCSAAAPFFHSHSREIIAGKADLPNCFIVIRNEMGQKHSDTLSFVREKYFAFGGGG